MKGRRKRFSKKSIKKGEISRDKEKEKGKEKDQGPMCYECKKPRHMRYDCPSIKSYMRKKMKKALFKAWTDNESSSLSSEGEEHTNIANICLMAYEDDEECLAALKSKKRWYLNSGCSRHMMDDINQFFILKSK